MFELLVNLNLVPRAFSPPPPQPPSQGEGPGSENEVESLNKLKSQIGIFS